MSEKSESGISAVEIEVNRSLFRVRRGRFRKLEGASVGDTCIKSSFGFTGETLPGGGDLLASLRDASGTGTCIQDKFRITL